MVFASSGGLVKRAGAAACGGWLRGVAPRFLISSLSTVSCGSDDGELIVHRDADTGVATLTLNRPDARNALSMSLLRDIKRELSACSEDYRNIRVVVIAGNGPVFSSGHDLNEVRACSGSDADELFEYCSEVMQLIENLPQPVIAAVHGVATAAGCQLAAACDLVVAHESSTFSTLASDWVSFAPRQPLHSRALLEKKLQWICCSRDATYPQRKQKLWA